MGEHIEEEPVSMDPVALLDFSKSGGLVTAIAQDAVSEEILMVAHMNEESFRLTVETGEADSVVDVGVQVFDPEKVYKK
jgi:phosphoribosyl-AMP cyclohydrolase